MLEKRYTDIKKYTSIYLEERIQYHIGILQKPAKRIIIFEIETISKLLDTIGAGVAAGRGEISPRSTDRVVNKAITAARWISADFKFLKIKSRQED